MPGVQSWFFSGVAADAPSDPERHVGLPPLPGRPILNGYLFPKRLLRIQCLVDGCLGEASSLILEEGNGTYPRWPQCDMFVSQKSPKGQHLATDFFRRGEKRKWRTLAEEEAWAVTQMALTAYWDPLSPSTSFKYLRRAFPSEDVARQK